jgi:hypothetical protein
MNPQTTFAQANRADGRGLTIMGVRILHDNDRNMAAIYCSTTDLAFGPVFYADREHDADERAEAFLRWLPKDARVYDGAELSLAFSEWLAQELAQWQREEAPKCDDCGEPIESGAALCKSCLERATA